MTTQEFETIISEEIAECKYASEIDKIRNSVFDKIKSVHQGCKTTEFLYFWEKVSGAKKRNIELRMNGGDCN